MTEQETKQIRQLAWKVTNDPEVTAYIRQLDTYICNYFHDDLKGTGRIVESNFSVFLDKVHEACAEHLESS